VRVLKVSFYFVKEFYLSNRGVPKSYEDFGKSYKLQVLQKIIHEIKNTSAMQAIDTQN
jgi:hypothetical protein